MTQTLTHTEVLQCSVEEMWEACKHADTILPDLMPEFFGKSELLQGRGEPGSIRVITMGPEHTALPHIGQVKERIDKFDDESKTFGYTVLEGDPRYSHFNAEMQFVPVGDTTEAIWTAKYEPIGDMGPPEHIKDTAVQVFKTFERAVMGKKIMTHTEILEASPDAIWKTCKHMDEILPKVMPQFFASTTMLKGHGEPGSIRVIKMGPAIPHVGEVTERMDLFDDVTKKLGYTVIKGDPRYKYFAATMQYTSGPTEGTTTATWVATYVPMDDMGPPDHIKSVVVLVWKALEGATKTNPELYA